MDEFYLLSSRTFLLQAEHNGDTGWNMCSSVKMHIIATTGGQRDASRRITLQLLRLATNGNIVFMSMRTKKVLKTKQYSSYLGLKLGQREVSKQKVCNKDIQ